MNAFIFFIKKRSQENQPTKTNFELNTKQLFFTKNRLHVITEVCRVMACPGSKEAPRRVELRKPGFSNFESSLTLAIADLLFKNKPGELAFR